MIKHKLLAVVTLACAAHAQTSRGTVTGTVLDPSGAAISGAQASLIGIQTGVKLSTTGNDAGIYRFDAVDLGVYELQVAHPGFRNYVAAGIAVEANRVTTVDPRLEVGAAETRIEVNGESSEMLVKDSPLRGGNFQTREVRDLPLVGLNPLSLTETLPGATDARGSSINAGLVNAGAAFSINGQRPRSNNYMLDGTDNNETWLSGEAQVLTIADAIEEVSGQTGNFSVEFGRAAGGVLNVITKSGTNNLHGTMLWRFQSQRFDSVSNTDKLSGAKQAVFSENIFGFTAGGPVRKNKTFFFAGFQQQYFHSTSNNLMQIPTAYAVTSLQSLFPNNPRLELYLGALGNLRGTGAPFNVALGVDPQTGLDRGYVQFATGSYTFPAKNDGSQWLGRIDHYQSEGHRLSLRFSYDSLLTLPCPCGSSAGVISFPGFVKEQAFSHDNVVFTDSYTFGPSYTNEFRFSYERPDAQLGTPWPGSVPAAQTLPGITITGVAAPGLNNSGQFYYGNNFLFQETQTKLRGGHAIRYGVEFMRQNIIETPTAATLGTVSFVTTSTSSYSAFANFLDDYSGPSAMNAKVFGATPFHPGQLRQSYFFQDNWKITPTLALTLGLRYENSGQPANSLRYPAFAGFDPSQFLVRHEVHRDNLDFGPAFGLAWSPSLHSGLLSRLLGAGKTVFRGGYQISYDTFFTQLMTTAAVGTPNAINTTIAAANTGRGAPDWFERLPTSAATPSLTDSQSALDPNLRSPYTGRWSFGFERQLPRSVLVDVSYVGSESHRLYTPADLNPRLLNGLHLYPNYGPVLVIDNEGNSSYHALQARLDRRFSRGFQLSASYTWSKDIDSISDVVGGLAQSPKSSKALTSVPISQGGLKLDRGLGDYDRTHRLTIVYLWAIPGPRAGWVRYALGGWSLAGITTFQSGTPFTVGNGFDRNNDTFSEDRPDIGNPNEPLNTRAIFSNTCATGFQNPDTLSCVSPSDVHWVEGAGFPNAATVGRNTLHTGGTNNFDLNLTKSIPEGEKRRLELRWEAFNAFNHPQFIQVPQMSVLATPAGQFLNRDFTNSGIRTMWVQAKLVF
ncbi:MAG TPA: carboxypeptidase regulatory-like domain-containing protein [Bryobacteraceae bacterium]|nr:carboxypeptidase regulatory-like domain-containing protein [Bryobacteraceae bacterium]